MNNYKSVYQAIFIGFGLLAALLATSFGSNIVLICKGISSHDVFMTLWGGISILILVSIILFVESGSFSRKVEGMSSDIARIKADEKDVNAIDPKDDINNKLND